MPQNFRNQMPPYWLGVESRFFPKLADVRGRVFLQAVKACPDANRVAPRASSSLSDAGQGCGGRAATVVGHVELAVAWALLRGIERKVERASGSGGERRAAGVAGLGVVGRCA